MPQLKSENGHAPSWNLRGKLAIKDNEKVAYSLCKFLIKSQPVSLQPISPLLNIGETKITRSASPQMALSP